MKITDFKVRAPRGTYYGAHLTPETREAILDFMSDNKIPNPLSEDLMHVTVIHSRVWCPVKALGNIEPHWEGKFNKYNLWATSPKEKDDKDLNEEQEQSSNCLTLGFDCPEMHERHHALRKEGATHDFPDFKPHITLSYDAGNEYDHHALPQYSGPLKFHHEYSEPLNLNFVKTKVNK